MYTIMDCLMAIAFAHSSVNASQENFQVIQALVGEKAKNNLSADFGDVMNPRQYQCGGRAKTWLFLKQLQKTQQCESKGEERATASQRLGMACSKSA